MVWYEVIQMSDFLKKMIDPSLENQMKAGYEDWGKLNEGLSEEGLEQDRKDLESYEKYLVESE
jgi:hypothetical protein